jgi:1,4-dihydroxy-2-naphthoyl-CoA hydrolase
VSVSDCEVHARVRVADHHLQPAGLVHGGVVASMAEAMASHATHLAVVGDGLSAQGVSNNTSFLRPLGGPVIRGLARRRHRGRTIWVWDVEVCDDDDRLCALTRMTVAVRPRAA